MERDGEALLTLRKTQPVCDLVFASRCLFELDPDIVLPKLTAHAKKRVCITLHVSLYDTRLSGMFLTGKESAAYFKAVVNTIIDMGFFPRIDYMACNHDPKDGWAFISWDK